MYGQMKFPLSNRTPRLLFPELPAPRSDSTAFAFTWCLSLIGRSRLLGIVVSAFTAMTLLTPTTANALKQSPIRIHFDWSSHVERGVDCVSRGDAGCIGDNWPTTWTLGGDLLTSWGDGPGPRRRVGHSIGIANVSGPENGFSLDTVYSGYAQGQGDVAYNGNCNGKTWLAGRVCGKTYAMIDIVGTTWMWVSPGSAKTNYDHVRLYRSSDNGASWRPVKNKAFGKPGEPRHVEFSLEEMTALPAFAQFGRGYSDFATNKFWVYVYSIRPFNVNGLQVQHNGKRGAIDLARVRPWNLDDRSKFEWFSGRAKKPAWSKDRSKRRAVFKDGKGVGWNLSVAWVPGIDRFVMMTERKKSFGGNLGIYESETPWGPWRVIARYDNWACQTGAPKGVGAKAFYWNIPTRFINPEQRSQWMFFSGIHADDSFNAVRTWFSDQQPEVKNCS